MFNTLYTTRRFRLSIVFILSFLLGINSVSHSAKAQCASIPQSKWSKALSHESVIRYVEQKYQGHWTPYIEKLEKQYHDIKAISDKGSSILVTKKRIKVQGQELEIYTGRIKQRLDVFKCLAEEERLIDQLSAPPSSNAQASNPQASYLTASITLDSATSVRNSTNRIDPVIGRDKAREAGCLECHGKWGRGGDNLLAPYIAGQNDAYLAKQLFEFQRPQITSSKTSRPNGIIERHNAIMSKQAANLSKTDIWNLSTYFSMQPCRTDAPDAAPEPLPEVINACTQCHGYDGRSVFLEVPNIAGQRQDYLARQLVSFRTAALQMESMKMESDNIGNTEHDVRYHYLMSMKAKDLSDHDIIDLSKYYAALKCEAE